MISLSFSKVRLWKNASYALMHSFPLWNDKPGTKQQRKLCRCCVATCLSEVWGAVSASALRTLVGAGVQGQHSDGRDPLSARLSQQLPRRVRLRSTLGSAAQSLKTPALPRTKHRQSHGQMVGPWGPPDTTASFSSLRRPNRPGAYSSFSTMEPCGIGLRTRVCGPSALQSLPGPGKAAPQCPPPP